MGMTSVGTLQLSIFAVELNQSAKSFFSYSHKQHVSYIKSIELSSLCVCAANHRKYLF